MFVKITLYKTQFATGDIFVGESAASRRASLDTLPKFELPISSYNPGRPFRLAVNYLAVQDTYNYAIYDFYNSLTDSELVRTRSYFITDYIYVNDNVTDVVIRRDILADYFYDLKFARLSPAQYTFRDDRGLDILNPDSLYSFNAGTRLPYKWTDENYYYTQLRNADGDLIPDEYLGFIILTSLYSTYTPYIECGQEFPCLTQVLPFVFNGDGKVLNKYTFNLAGNTSGNVADIRDLQSYFEQQTSGFKYIGSTIITHFSNLIEAAVTRTTQTVVINFRDASFKNVGVGYTVKGKQTICLYEVETLPEVPLFSNMPEVSIYWRQPFHSLKLLGNFADIDIDPLNMPLNVTLCQSLVPPYNLILKDSSNSWVLVPNRSITVSPDTVIYDYTDNFAEFMRNNYNATIMGLRTQEKFAAVDVLRNLNFIDMKNSITNIADTALNTIKSREILNQRLADVKNASDNVSFNGSISVLLNNKKILHLQIGTCLRLEEFKRYHKAYGYEYIKDISESGIKSHTLFDYIAASDLVINNTDLSLSENEINLISEYLSNGVRVWYQLENFKNFNVENPEIKEV